MGQAQAKDALQTPASLGVGWRLFQLGGFLTAVSWFLSYFLFLDGYTALQVVFGTDNLLWVIGGIGYFLSPLLSVVLIAIAVWPGALAFLNGDGRRALAARAVLFLIPFLWLGSVFVGDTAMVNQMLTNPLGKSVALPVMTGATVHVVFQHWFQGFAAMLLAMVPERFSTLTDSDRPAGGGAVIREVTAEMELERRLVALHEATRAMMAADSPNEVARIASEASSEIVGTPYSRVHLQEEDGDELVPAAWTDETERALDGDPPTVDPDSGLVWERFQTGEAGYFHEYAALENAPNQETPLDSSLLLPLGDHGIMLLQATEPGAFSDANIELAHILSANTQAALARVAQEREMELVRALLDQSSNSVFVLDPDTGLLLDVNDTACGHLGYTRAELLSMTFHEIVASLDERPDVGAVLQEAHAQGAITLTGTHQCKDDSTIPVQVTVNHLELDQEYIIAIAQDITEQQEREQELAVQRTELQLLGFLQTLVDELVQQVLGSTSRPDLELQACEMLTESPFYVDAWLVDPSPDAQLRALHERTGTADGGKLRSVDEMSSEAPTTEAIYDTIETNTSQVVTRDREATDASTSEPGTEAAAAGQAESATETILSLPLTYAESTYGALVVVADRQDAFGIREQAALETLTTALALAIHVRMQGQASGPDTTELEFRATEPASVGATLAATLGCLVRLEGIVPSADDRVVHYYVVETETGTETETKSKTEPGTEPGTETEIDDLRERVAAAESVKECRILDHDDGEWLVEVQGHAPDILDRIVDAGAVIRTAEAWPDESRLVIDLPPGMDPEVVKAVVQDADAAWTLAEQRQVERSMRRMQDACQMLEESLTAKQREALLTAYFAGYYDHPRTSTAQEVANTLAITDSTLYQHLQAAQRKLIEAWVDPTQQDAG